MNKDEFKELEKELQQHAVGDVEWLRVLHKAFIEVKKPITKESNDTDSLLKEFENSGESEDAKEIG